MLKNRWHSCHRFFSSDQIHHIIAQEYDGTNIKTLAAKYNYSEKTVRRIVKGCREP